MTHLVLTLQGQPNCAFTKKEKKERMVLFDQLGPSNQVFLEVIVQLYSSEDHSFCMASNF